MPLYIAYCPDYPDNLQTRLSVRDAHLAAATEDKKTGASGESEQAMNCPRPQASFTREGDSVC